MDKLQIISEYEYVSNIAWDILILKFYLLLRFVVVGLYIVVFCNPPLLVVEWVESQRCLGTRES